MLDHRRVTVDAMSIDFGCPSVRPSSFFVRAISRGRRDLILGMLERSGPVDVPFGIFDQIRSTESAKIAKNSPKSKI